MIELQDRKIIEDIVKKEIQSNAYNAQFVVGPIPYHAHTGIDSPQVDGSNLSGAILARVASTTSTATPTPAPQSTDLLDITAQTATASFQPPSGFPTNGQLLRIRVTSSNAATARALVWSTATGGYIANSPALPASTTTGKTSNFGFEYDTSNSVNKWRLLWAANS